MEAAPSMSGKLSVRVGDAKGLKSKGYNDRYIILKVGTKQRRTSEKHGHNPQWNEETIFDITGSTPAVLTLTIYDADSNESIGTTDVEFGKMTFNEDGRKADRFPLKRKSGKNGGDILLTFTFQPKGVKLARQPSIVVEGGATPQPTAAAALAAPPGAAALKDDKKAKRPPPGKPNIVPAPQPAVLFSGNV